MVRISPLATYAKTTHTDFMSTLKYIPETDDFNDNPTPEFYSGPVLMGREREYFKQRNIAVKEFIDQQKNSDLQAEYKKKVDTSNQLFGISAQNNNKRISLDEKFPGDMFYKITTDHMSPLIPINSYMLLKFSEQHASGEVCVYRYRGQTYCNQIKLENNKVLAVSINQKYKTVVLDPDEYFFIAVVYSFHRSLKEV
jgi:phage repressor protein C with HTH and peptisase S24 domain